MCAAAGNADDRARPCLDALVLEVDRQRAALDAVDLGRRVAVQRRRAATRGQPDLDGEQGAVGLRAGGAEGELVGADAEDVHR
jgi:hypothetical protein